jgi:N-acetylneuraminic acid mutarotase
MTDVLEIFDPLDNTWTRGARLPKATSAFALTAYEGKIYLFGGWDGTSYLNSVYEYDPALDAWSVKPSMPTPRAYLRAAVAGGKIYVLGGYDGKKALSVNETYQPNLVGSQGDPWSYAKPLPEGLYAMGANSLVDIIYVIGGKGDTPREFPALAFFYETEEWRSLEDSSVDPGSYIGLASIGTKLYVFGGEVAGLPSLNNQVYSAIYAISFPIIIK